MSTLYQLVFLVYSAWKTIRWYDGNPAARHSPPATIPANPLPTTPHPGTPNFSVPDLAPADNKIQSDRQKNTLLQRKSKYYLFIYSNRTWEFSLQERSLQNVINY